MRVLVLCLLVTVGLAPPALASSQPSADQVSVRIDQSEVHTGIGQRFHFTSTVRNEGNRPLAGLVAHLNILSANPGTYVDPEDWSSNRTVYLGPLPAHGSQQVTWQVQVVNDGRFVLYVAVTSRQGQARVDVSDGLRLSAAAQRTVNAGDVLPVALGVPGVVTVLMLLAARRRRRLR